VVSLVYVFLSSDCKQRLVDGHFSVHFKSYSVFVLLCSFIILFIYIYIYIYIYIERERERERETHTLGNVVG
jgi:hypothetical protein